MTLQVRNLRRQSQYTVFVPAYPDRTGAFCGCVDFARRDLGTCKHLEAAWLWLADQPPESIARRPPTGPSPVWASVDRRARHRVPAGTPASARLRHLGGALLR